VPSIFQSFADFAQLLYPRKPTPEVPVQPLITDLTIAQAAQASPSYYALHSPDNQAMAYQLADPSPFMPRGFQKLEVQGGR
jgi:hypothetical protein